MNVSSKRSRPCRCSPRLAALVGGPLAVAGQRQVVDGAPAVPVALGEGLLLGSGLGAGERALLLGAPRRIGGKSHRKAV